MVSNRNFQSSLITNFYQIFSPGATMVDFRTITTFMWVANLRSFRAAAEKLNTTQPAVSLRIAQLEKQLGVRLLERNRRLVVPTEKGHQLLGFAERLLCLRTEMIEAVGDRSSMHGMVRLGVAETIVHTWLPALIERVNDAYPNLELEIEVDISPNLRDRLVARDLDLAFLLGPVSNPNVQNRPLCSYPLAFVACKTIKFDKQFVALEDIARWPIITFSRNTQPYVAVRELFTRSRLHTTIHASASLATVVRMALDGIGVAVIPPAILANVAPRGQLRLLKTRTMLPRLDFAVSWPSSPDSFAAQKVAGIATAVAKRRGMLPNA
jgi:DNA-binding transcriptional LysR family regulator